MNDFFKSMKSMIKPKTSQIQSMIRLMTAEVNSRITNEKNSLNYVDKAIYRYMNDKNKDALIQAAQRYVVASRRISGLELIKTAIQKVQSEAQYLKEQPPPVDLYDPLNTICWSGHFLNFESVRNFSDRILVYAYGRNTVSTFSNSNTLSQDVRDCFYNEEVSEDEYRKLLYDYAQSHGMDKSAIDDIIGARQSATIQLNYPSLADINQNQFQTMPSNQFPNQNIPQTQYQTSPVNQFNQPPQQPQFSNNFQNQQSPQFNPASQPPQFTPMSQPPQFIPTSQPPQFTPTSQPPQFNPNSPSPQNNSNQPPQFNPNSNQPPQFNPNSNQPPQFNPNSPSPQNNSNQGIHFTTVSQPPQFTPTSEPPKYTPPPPPSESGDNDNTNVKSSDNEKDQQNSQENFKLEKKPTLSSAGSFSFYPGSTPVEQSYQFNENLLPLVPLQPFDKENWPYLQESIAVATSYKNEKKNKV